MLVGLAARLLGKKAGKKVFKAKKKVGAKVSKVKGTKTYASAKSKESLIRGVVGMKGSGRLNRIRRKAQGPVGYAALGAAAFSGDDD
jgi:hypothetical protein